MNRTALALVLTIAAAPVQSQIYGSHLSEWCAQFPDVAAGYVTGVINGISIAHENSDLEGDQRFCIPPHATMLHLSDIVCAHVASHPILVEARAPHLVSYSIRQAMPCPD